MKNTTTQHPDSLNSWRPGKIERANCYGCAGSFPMENLKCLEDVGRVCPDCRKAHEAKPQ